MPVGCNNILLVDIEYSGVAHKLRLDLFCLIK